MKILLVLLLFSSYQLATKSTTFSMCQIIVMVHEMMGETRTPVPYERPHT